MRLRPILSLCAAVLLLAACGSGDGPSAEEQADTMQTAHEDDAPEATAAAREPVLPVNGATVAYASTEQGEPITGYIAAPERPDSILAARGLNPDSTALPGIVVIHEWWGLNDNIRTAARRLAGEGYRVLAVDLYADSQADTPEGARELMQTALQDKDRLLANLEKGYQYLTQEANAPRTAVLGWCFGGSMALSAAVTMPDRLDGAVIYYGSPEGIGADELEAVSFPMIGFFGAEDGAIPVDQVRSFEQTLNDLGKEADIYIYEDAGHAFANPSGTNYNPEAASDAWDKTTAFLNRTLYPQS